MAYTDNTQSELSIVHIIARCNGSTAVLKSKLHDILKKIFLFANAINLQEILFTWFAYFFLKFSFYKKSGFL